MTTAPGTGSAAPGESTGIIRTVDLTKVYRGADFRAVDELNLDGGCRRDLRSSRPQRRRQDDHRGNAHHPGHPDLGQGIRRRHRRGRPSGPREAAHRNRLAAEHPRPPARPSGRTSTSTAGSSASVPPGVAADGRRAARAVSADEMGEGLGVRAVGRHGPAPHGGPGDLPSARRSCSWTSRPPGLDPQSRLALWDILGELNADGQTILLTTHYMEEADQLCERVAIMDHGKILALDTPGRAEAERRAPTPS